MKRPLLAQLTALLSAALFAVCFVFAACSKPGDANAATEEPTLVSPRPTGNGGEAAPTDVPVLAFRNELDFSLGGAYFSAAELNEWGEPALTALPGGQEKELTFEQLGVQPGVNADIGAVDENGINYDVFGVILWPGDCVILKGDHDSGLFTVVHSDGSRDIYTAKVYWNAPTRTAKTIGLEKRSVSETVRDAQGNTLGTVNCEFLSLSATDREKYPLLDAALGELNEGRLAALRERMLGASQAEPTAQPGAEPPGGGAGEETPAPRAGSREITETADVRRSDSVAVSVIFETRAGDERSFSGAVFDPQTGEMLTPAQVVTDVMALPHRINLKLGELEGENAPVDGSGEPFTINEYREHSADFSAQSRYFAFALGPDSLIFIFNQNAFRSGLTAPVEVALPFGENPHLILPRFLTAGQ